MEVYKSRCFKGILSLSGIMILSLYPTQFALATMIIAYFGAAGIFLRGDSRVYSTKDKTYNDDACKIKVKGKFSYGVSGFTENIDKSYEIYGLEAGVVENAEEYIYSARDFYYGRNVGLLKIKFWNE